MLLLLLITITTNVHALFTSLLWTGHFKVFNIYQGIPIQFHKVGATLPVLQMRKLKQKEVRQFAEVSAELGFVCVCVYVLGPHLGHMESSWARGQIRAAGASLHHSHSRSEPGTYTIAWAMPDGTHILMDTRWVLNLLSHEGNSSELRFEPCLPSSREWP